MIQNKLSKLPVIVLLSILLVFFYLLMSDRDPSEIPSAFLNKKVPSFQTNSLIKIDKFYSIDNFGNEVTLVNFFASWCKPCRDEHKYIKLFDDTKNIKIIGINYKDNPDTAIKWLEQFGNPYSDIAIDKNGNIAIDWGVYGIPETFIVDANGVIKYRHVGPITKKIYKKINLLINELNNEK